MGFHNFMQFNVTSNSQQHNCKIVTTSKTVTTNKHGQRILKTETKTKLSNGCIEISITEQII